VVNAPLGENQQVSLTGYRWSDDSSRIVFTDYFGDFRRRETLNLWVGATDGAAPIRLNGTFDYDGQSSY